MNLFSLLNRREKSITIGIIGAGKFATMFFAQALKIPSIHIVGVVDIVPETTKFFSIAVLAKLLFLHAHKNNSNVNKLYFIIFIKLIHNIYHLIKTLNKH